MLLVETWERNLFGGESARRPRLARFGAKFIAIGSSNKHFSPLAVSIADLIVRHTKKPYQDAAWP
jgi:hypothetical protein